MFRLFLENLVTSKILEPLEMDSTWILKNPSDVLKADVARTYSFRDGEFKKCHIGEFLVSYFKSLSSVYYFGSENKASWLKAMLHSLVARRWFRPRTQ